MKNLRKAWRLPLEDWALIFRAVAELAIVRLQLAMHAPRQLLIPEPIRVPQGLFAQPSRRATQMVDRVSWAIGVAACRVPWRSDCLVRARAARRWLAREGIPTEMFIGVRKDRGSFEAHAWLLQEGKTVTGGDFSAYSALMSPNQNEAREVKSMADGNPRRLAELIFTTSSPNPISELNHLLNPFQQMPD